MEKPFEYYAKFPPHNKNKEIFRIFNILIWRKKQKGGLDELNKIQLV